MVDIESARKGDADAARAILRDFAEMVGQRKRPDGTPHITPTGTSVSLDWPIADYLAECFQAILEGVEPGKALGIAGEAGRPEIKTSAKNERDVRYCLAIMESKRKNKGETLLVHFKQVARHFHLPSHSTVRAAWKRPEIQLAAKLINRMADRKGPKNSGY